MKKVLTLLFLFLLGETFAQNLIFTNANLKAYLISSPCVDLNGDGIGDTVVDSNADLEVQVAEAMAITDLVIGPGGAAVIESIADIHQFTNLKRLALWGDFSLQAVSGLALDSLEYIRISDHNSIHEIDLSDLPNLTSIYIEGVNGLQNLNLRNGSYASEAFSLFYTYVQNACVDSIAAEYTLVSDHLVAGGSISINCSIGTKEETAVGTEPYPNPTNGLIHTGKAFEYAELFNPSGRLVKKQQGPAEQLDITSLESGAYLLRLRFPEGLIRYYRLLKR